MSNEARRENAMRFLVEELKTATILAKAQGSALRVLCLGRDWRALVDTFVHQLKPQIAPSFDRLLDSMLSEEPSIPMQDEDWEQTARKLIESAFEPGPPE
jgi:hypothetical protein